MFSQQVEPTWEKGWKLTQLINKWNTLCLCSALQWTVNSRLETIVSESLSESMQLKQMLSHHLRISFTFWIYSFLFRTSFGETRVRLHSENVYPVGLRETTARLPVCLHTAPPQARNGDTLFRENHAEWCNDIPSPVERPLKKVCWTVPCENDQNCLFIMTENQLSHQSQPNQN